MGLGFYKIRRNRKWNIISRDNPVMELLSEDYDSITNLGSQSIPGPGLPHFFLGIEVRIAEFISFFELKKNEFVFKGKYTRAELERRKDFS